jgi:hypothetical protein
MEWVFFGQGIILSRCIQNFEPKEFSVDLGVLEQARILATSIVNNALGVSSSEKILNLKTAIINAELRFGNCYSQKAHACVNLKYSNQIRFNSKRDTPISRFYGSFEEPLLNIAQTIIHEASHTLGEAEISATVLELEIFSRAELRIPHYNGYVATYKIWPKEL